MDELRIARGDGSYSKTLRQLARLDLLILDNFGLKPLSQSEHHDLLEIIENRHELHSTDGITVHIHRNTQYTAETMKSCCKKATAGGKSRSFQLPDLSPALNA